MYNPKLIEPSNEKSRGKPTLKYVHMYYSGIKIINKIKPSTQKGQAIHKMSTVVTNI